MTFALTVMHMPYEQYLIETSDTMRMVNAMWYQLYLIKKDYANTPEKDRFPYLSRYSV